MPWWCVESWEISLWNLNLCYVLNILGESVSYWIVSRLEGTCRIINLSDRGENCKSQEYKMSHGIHQSSKYLLLFLSPTYLIQWPPSENNSLKYPYLFVFVTEVYYNVGLMSLFDIIWDNLEVISWWTLMYT